jgi:enediyne biosynthesis protein E4
MTSHTTWLVVLGLGMGCAQRPLPPDQGGAPFWHELDFALVQDQGHEVRLLEPDERTPAGPITLVDVTEAAGLGMAVGGGNTHGVGAAFVDVDGDGWPDIFVANGRSNRSGEQFRSLLYRNQGDGTFVDITEQSGIGAILGDRDCYSAAAADYDGDGDIDLYVGAQPTDVLLRNRGDGTFEDATAAAGAGGPASEPLLVGDGRSKIAVFGDFDGDGDMDIVSASSTLPSPGAYLLRNQGDGTFVDITAETGVKIHSRGNPCAVMWSDYDNDGDPDLWIWNDRGGHILLQNQNGTHFDDVTARSALDEVDITNPMGIDAADIDHDGDLDYYISNIGDNPLLRNNGDGTFVDITREAGTGGRFGWGLAFEDFDHDTYADIFVAQEDNLPHLLFRNLGGASPAFEQLEIAHIPVRDTVGAHNVAVAFADYDGDGRVDVLTAGTDGTRVTLYRNQTETGTQRWLHVAVRPEIGPESRDGIGARIGVKTGDLVQFRDITGGSSRASQNQHTVRFGLGHWSGADWVAVLWPSGRQIIWTNVAAGQLVTLH